MKSNLPQISIIIPVWNEAKGISPLLDYLNAAESEQRNVLEVICVDGGSTDGTLEVLETKEVTLVSAEKGRAKQMNTGAREAKADILYFLHADTYPPKNFDTHILEAIKNKSVAGCFRMQFDTQNPILRFFAWLSRINHTLCRGGDQSLFIQKDAFLASGGFNESYRIYEDTEFITRLYAENPFTILPHHVVTSARKYREKGWLKVQFHFAMIHLKNYLGAGPEELYQYYRKNILT
ncbi:MAG: TIGR04283 family arsenosugar biosynthesis glycosyltransferase [Bacteroidota bacterium]